MIDRSRLVHGRLLWRRATCLVIATDGFNEARDPDGDLRHRDAFSRVDRVHASVQPRSGRAIRSVRISRGREQDDDRPCSS